MDFFGGNQDAAVSHRILEVLTPAGAQTAQAYLAHLIDVFHFRQATHRAAVAQALRPDVVGPIQVSVYLDNADVLSQAC